MVKFDIDKEENFSEWFDEILKKADLIDKRYPAKGFIAHKPNAEYMEDKIQRMIEEELKKTDHKKARFPNAIPKHILQKEADHIEGFEPEVFWITHGGRKELPEKLGLTPTSETVMYTMYSKWIESYRDLPLKIYQRCPTWRYETKHTRPLLRDREFEWIEAHNAFENREEAEKQVKEDIEIAQKVIKEKLGVPFHYFKRPEWDKFAGAVYTFGADALMPDGRLIQIPSTHLLGTNFAEQFNIRYEDRDGKKKKTWQTCFGPAVGRIFAAMISIHGDNKGLRLPWEIAPIQIVIVPILHGENKEINEKAEKIKEKLEEKEVRVKLDDSDSTPGEKFNHWEMMGIPIRIEIGENELKENKLTIKRRDTGKREEIKEKELNEYIERIPGKILENLRKQATEKFKENTIDVETKEEVEEALKNKKIARSNWCSIDKSGEKCAEQLAEEIKGAKVRGTIHHKEERAKGKCLICGEKANEVVYIAREY